MTISRAQYVLRHNFDVTRLGQESTAAVQHLLQQSEGIGRMKQADYDALENNFDVSRLGQESMEAIHNLLAFE